ncbi:hypothetical protein ACMA1I_05065 [Pontibacter sp. 13R65]|uniref:hypothetical protein n=1 Tax=Pontibacter sp. 13R65 TaxID=3127458 RepID=UPI00301D7930
MNPSEKETQEQEFREVLQEMVQQKVYVRVQYHSEIGEFLAARALLKELKTTDGGENLILATGEEIPLSRLVRVGDKPAPGYDTEYFKCDI